MSDLDEIPIQDEPDFEELTTLDRFRHRASGRWGVIVIKDGARGEPIFHHRDSPCVSESYFLEKVVDNRGDHGAYWWAKNPKIAEAALGARRCRTNADPISKN